MSDPAESARPVLLVLRAREPLTRDAARAIRDALGAALPAGFAGILLEQGLELDAVVSADGVQFRPDAEKS